jgi:single-strand DNA-binding protein
MVNKVILIGNLTKPAEIKNTSSGGVVALLNLATNESWVDKTSGEKKSKAEYHRITIFNRLAEVVQKLDLDTGTQLYIEGQLTHRDYLDKTGQKKYVTEVKLGGFGSELKILSKKANTQAQAPATQVADAPASITPVATEEFDDDIPF